jgi:hypothetical protein
MIIFKKIRYRNFLSTGNQFNEINFLQHETNLIVGTNGAGKCLHKSTEVDIQFLDKEVEKKFKKFIKNKKNS